MDKFEDGFEWFVDQMCEMVLNLLGFLDIKKIQAEVAQPIQILRIVHLLVLHLLGFKTHIAADSTYMRTSTHVVIHFVECFWVGTETDI